MFPSEEIQGLRNISEGSSLGKALRHIVPAMCEFAFAG